MEPAGQDLVSRARCILHAPKRGEGENTSGVFGQVFVCAAGMLAVYTNQIALSGNQHK